MKIGWRNPGSIISPNGFPKNMLYPERSYPILFILGESMPSHSALFYLEIYFKKKSNGPDGYTKPFQKIEGINFQSMGNMCCS